MDWLTLLVGVAVLAALLLPLVLTARAWRSLTSRRVVVNLKTGRALDGLLVRRRADLLFLRNATALEPGAEPMPLDGEAVVARADIDFIQAV